MKTTARIKIELSKQSLERAKKLIQKFANEYEQGIKDAIRTATEAMYEKVLEYCHDSEIYNHIDAIHWEYNEETNIGRVWTNDWVLLFNEYGTGVVGSQNPHPNANGWTYDMNQHGERGWYYPKGDGTYGWTKGLPSKHMFYDAFEDIKDLIGDKIHVEMQSLSGKFYE